MRPRISIWGRVHPSVRRSVGWIVGRSVTHFFWNAENKLSSIWKSLGQSNIDIAEYAWCAGYAKCAKCAIYAICASCASCASCTSWTHHWPAGPCFSYTVTVWKYWFQDFKACHLKMHYFWKKHYFQTSNSSAKRRSNLNSPYRRRCIANFVINLFWTCWEKCEKKI